jgi:proteasome lid subunit RPN8/RPN11
VADGVAEMTHCFPLVNGLGSPTRYESEPRSLFAAVRGIRDAGVELVAVYHSHPTSEPVPSRTDREQNYYGDTVVHLIVGLVGEVPVVRAWRLTGDETVEVQLVVEG